MRIHHVLGALLAVTLCATAAAAADSDKARLLAGAPALTDPGGRFALAATLSPLPASKTSRSPRFVLAADLDAVSADPPGNSRYTLVSSLGSENVLGSCGGGLPDPVFRNGFEN